MCALRAVADDDHRAPRCAQQLAGLRHRARRRRDAQVGACGPRARHRRSSGAGSVWTSSGKIRCATSRSQQRVLDAQRGELGVAALGQHGLRPARDRRERRREVDVLKRAGAEHLHVHLAGQREHRRAVDLRVPEAGDEVRRAGPGDRQARRRPAGELAERRRGERRGALVADADVRQVAGLTWRRIASARPRFECPTMPNTCVTPQATSVSHHQIGDRPHVRRRLRRRRRRPRPRGSRAGTPTPCRCSCRAASRSAGSSRSRATGSAGCRSRSSLRRAARPGAGSGCPARRSGRRSASARGSCARR